MRWLLTFGVFGLFGLATLLFFPTKIFATSVCGGTITCHQIVQQCVNTVTGQPCTCFIGELNCNDTPMIICNGTPPRTDPCSNFDQASCTDPANWISYCDTGCTQVGAFISATCNWQADACQAAGNCPSFPNQTCCAGSPNYCSTVGFDCAGNPLGPTPTPTPALIPCNGTCATSINPGACTTSTGQPGFYQWDGNPSGSTTCQTNPNTYCYNCVAAGGATPTPTPIAGATATPTPPGVGGGGGGGCDTTALVVCGVCQLPPPPICSGCQSTNGCHTECIDNSALCPVGTVCAGASCVTPTPGGCGGGDCPATPTPTPAATYTISGTVYVDTDSNGIQGAGESGYNGATVTVTGRGNRVTNLAGAYSFLGVPAGTYAVTLTVPPTYTATTSNPATRTVGPNATANFGIVKTPECSDRIDNDGNGLIDCADPGCHTDGNAGNPASCDPIDPFEPPDCSDTVDNDTDTRIDCSDPDCHTNGIVDSCPGTPTPTVGPGTPTPTPGSSYDPTDPSEIPDPPVCPGGLSANPSTVGSGSHSTLTVSGCTSTEPPTYTWPPPETVPPGGNGGSTNNVDNPTTTYTAPPNVCSDITVSQSVVVSNSGGGNTYSTNITVTPKNILSGGVFEDTGGNNCASGATAYGTGAVVTVYNGGNPTGSDTADGTGSYLITDTTACGSKTAVLSSVAGYTLRAVRFDAGAWSTSAFTGYTYGPFNFSSDHTLDFCVSNVFQWFQTTTGDVRMNALTNRVPAGQFASDDITNPSVFYSSSFTSNFGSGEVSTKGWKVDDEYSYEEDSRNRNGTTSYSFYTSRVNQKGLQVSEIPGCSPGSCSTGILNLATGVYKHDGDLEITSYSHSSGAHVLILVNGNLTIKSDISVSASNANLLIIAAKGNITIDKSVGTTDPTSKTTHLSGIFTAEGTITADGDDCPSGVSDKRLNVAGALVANSGKPFTVGGSGSFTNNRSLCLADRTNPSVYVTPRYDFITQLTDFYKTPYTRWREVAP